jgi:hypothetical protein
VLIKSVSVRDICQGVTLTLQPSLPEYLGKNSLVLMDIVTVIRVLRDAVGELRTDEAMAILAQRLEADLITVLAHIIVKSLDGLLSLCEANVMAWPFAVGHAKVWLCLAHAFRCIVQTKA